MLTPEVFAEVKGDDKVMCANVDLYSGLVYKVLKSRRICLPRCLPPPVLPVGARIGWRN